MRTLLIDGDELAYISALSGQQRWYLAVLGNGKELFRDSRRAEVIQRIGNSQNVEIIEEVEDLGTSQAIARSITWIADVLKGIGVTRDEVKLQIFFSGNNNFRYKIATILPYKGNRSDGDRPIHLQFMRDYIKQKEDWYEVDYLEADDLLAINQTEDTIIVTQDKDLNMVPGWRYFTHRSEFKLLEPDYCVRFFYMQLLTGDATDNIPGLSWVGEKTALKILGDSTDPEELYNKVYSEYESRVIDGKHLVAKGKRKGEISWETTLNTGEILWEIANLLWMRRKLGKDCFWTFSDYLGAW